MTTLLIPARGDAVAVFVEYDDHGYQVVADGEVVHARRLEAVCYLLGPQDREKISRQHALMDMRCGLVEGVCVRDLDRLSAPLDEIETVLVAVDC